MQYSFYGGQQGKNFEIAEIFDNKIQMMQDLMKRYQSQIAIGDLVLISYGMPNEETPSYRQNADLDVSAYGHTYNATLWQKIYTEENNKETQNVTGTEIEYISKDFGLGYKLIAVLTGNTPIFKIEYEALKANQKPSVTIDNTNIDFPILTFHLPVSQILALKNTLILNADQQPKVELDSTDINNPKLQFSLPQTQEILPKNVSTTILDADGDPEVVMENTGSNADGTLKVNKPTLEFKLPQGQQILPEHVTTTVLDADQDPKVVFDNDKNKTNADGSLKVNRPSLDFQLPQSQILKLGDVTVVDANQNPAVDLDETDINSPKLNIDLPRAQVLKLNPTIVLAPLDDPSSDLDETDINHPALTFSLPRAVRFMYGDRLGTREDVIYILALDDAPEIADLRMGDYYVHEGTGFIYLVTAEDETSRTFKYQACLAAPVPTVTSAAVDTYEMDDDGEFKVKDPIIKKSWSDPIEQIGLVLGFELPRLPDLKGEVEFVGPEEEGSIEGKPTGTNEYTYSFVIPGGAKFFCGNEVDRDNLDIVIEGAKPGDYYINGDTTSEDNGNLYKLDIKKHWVLKGNIKGRPGDPLNITHSFTITSDEVAEDRVQDVGNYIEAQLGKKPNPSDIIAVTYQKVEDDVVTDIAYWYYVVNDTWFRAQLTGGINNLIENDYVESSEDNPVTNKTYSIDYINKLIGGNITPDNADKTTFSKDQLYALFSWGTFEEAESGDWWPEIGEDKDTLSAEEILNLMSWGSMATLNL